MLSAALAPSVFDTVDIYNVTSARWSTAVLSVARQQLSGASLPDLGLAFFAGGRNAGIAAACLRDDSIACSMLRVQLFSCSDPRGVAFNAIDIYNAYTRQWSIAALSQARMYMAGTSLPEQGLVLFAGGQGE